MTGFWAQHAHLHTPKQVKGMATYPCHGTGPLRCLSSSQHHISLSPGFMELLYLLLSSHSSHPIPSVVPPLVPPPNQPQVCSLGQQLRWSSSAGHRDTGTKQGTEQWCRTWDPFQQNQLCFASLSLNPQVTAADNAMVSAAC